MSSPSCSAGQDNTFSSFLTMNIPATSAFLFALGKTIVSPSFRTKNEDGGPTNIDSMLVSVKCSCKTVWVRGGWEEVVRLFIGTQRIR